MVAKGRSDSFLEAHSDPGLSPGWFCAVLRTESESDGANRCSGNVEGCRGGTEGSPRGCRGGAGEVCRGASEQMPRACRR
eukprot:11223741-Alexandrium_andersonii.AAC.1